MKYFIIDAGEKMSDMAKLVMNKMDKDESHYLMFITDEEYYIGVEEVNEDHFLDVVNQMKAQLN